MRQILLIIPVILMLFQAGAQNPRVSLISQANEAYNNGSFTEAISLYGSVIDSGYVSAELYYNLGNAYYKVKDIPSAILYYEKALKLDPKDEQTRFNLHIANSQITDKIEAVPAMFYVRWWKALSGMFAPDAWARVTIGLLILLIILVTIFIVTRNMAIRRMTFWAGLIFSVLLLTSFYIAYQQYNLQSSDNYAIVFTPTVTVKSSPAKNSVDLFVIHEGTKVEITDQVEGWYEIRIANGSIGWLPMDSMKKI
jgi:tetratricopeptide (TPR) repeat protein